MFPILAIASAISATAAVVKGAMWLAERLSGDAGPADAKGATGSPDVAGASAFQATLSATMTGQEMPTAPTSPVGGGVSAVGGAMSTDATLAASRLSQDDVRARVHAGMTAYGLVGDRRDDRDPHVEG